MKEILLRLEDEAVRTLDHVSNLKETTKSAIIRKSLNMYFEYFKLKEEHVINKMNNERVSFIENLQTEDT